MSDEKCKCYEYGFRDDMSWEELLEKIVRPENYCTSLTKTRGAAGWICPTIEKALRRADVERQRRVQYVKRTGKPIGASKKRFEIPTNFKPKAQRVRA